MIAPETVAAAAPPGGTRVRHLTTELRRIPALGAIIAVLLGLTMSWVMWNDQRPLTFPDTMHYYQQSLRFTGESGDLSGKAMDFVCGDFRASQDMSHADKQDCRDYVGGSWRFPDPYNAIFTARPLYPLLAAPFLKVFGPPGFALCTLLIAAACGVAMYAAARAMGMSKAHALLAEFVFFILPTGYWCTRMLSEGTAVLGILIALVGAAKALRGGDKYLGVALTAFGLLWALLARSSSGQAAVAGLTAGALITAVVVAGATRRRALALAAVSAATGAGHLVVSAVLGLPGLKDSLHDFYGRHFQEPMPPDVYERLLRGNRTFWSDWMHALPVWNMGSGLALIGLAGVAMALRRLSAVWLAVAASAALPLALHPAMGDADRIGVHFWIVVALGIALVVRKPRNYAASQFPEAAAPSGR
ncbi:hypothetical protein GCM10023205_78270 [Yinghuangia aomiensis]|uniref:Dolichyl-phosphate-mannose-protein mannosyltransferase n=1 Tax=Yinghuangia aomiensis TaxID=676205 RepID=A0ABP9IBC6_9ACTN